MNCLQLVAFFVCLLVFVGVIDCQQNIPNYDFQKHKCIDFSEVKACKEEYKAELKRKIQDDNRKEVCCSIYGLEKCIVCVIQQGCGGDALKITKDFSRKMRDFTKKECEKYQDPFHCLSNTVLYIAIGIAAFLLLLLLICIICCCCCSNRNKD